MANEWVTGEHVAKKEKITKAHSNIFTTEMR